MITLDTLPVGHEAVITAVGGEGPLRCRLLDMGLIPKTRVRVEKIAPLGDPMELRVRGYALPCGRKTPGKFRWRWRNHDFRAGR